ncbi:hypothetical protein [Nannocystis pusilla]|uniref:hypothetical protein n=1 Tax=Nannocystis pusilla TaxID=889268 RepID=UPI003B79F49A
MPEALVIPGLVAIDPHRWEGRGQAELVRGPLAGKATRFELSDTKGERWLVPREVAARRGLRLPDQHPALAEFPRLRARLAEAALVRVDEAGRLAGATADAAIGLGYHRGAGGGNLEVALDGGRAASRPRARGCAVRSSATATTRTRRGAARSTWSTTGCCGR